MKSHRGYTYHGLVTLMLLLSYHAHAQNLVINPSFEETVTDCSEFDGERFLVDLPGTWDNAGIPSGSDTCSSPDLYSVCNVIIIPGFDTSTVMAVPNNLLGWQQPHSGTRYVGIVTHLAVGGNYREYIQGQLSQPLTAGQVYSVSLFVSAANEVPFATNNIGVYFSDTHYQNDPCSGKLGSFIT